MKVGLYCITKGKYTAGKHGISLLFIIERINASNSDHSVFYDTCEFQSKSMLRETWHRPISMVVGKSSTQAVFNVAVICRYQTPIPRAPVALPGLKPKGRVWRADAPAPTEKDKLGLTCKADKCNDALVMPAQPAPGECQNKYK